MRLKTRMPGRAVLPLIRQSLKGAVLAAPLFFAGPVSTMASSAKLPDRFEKTAFSALPGWESSAPLAALTSFRRFCPTGTAGTNAPELPGYGPKGIAELCAHLQGAALKSDADARRFLEAFFQPYRVKQAGFVTGYFEPEVAASRTRTGAFTVPLLKKPAGLVSVSSRNRPPGWPAELSHGRRTKAGLQEMPDRAAIMDGALDGEGLELAWLADPVDAYFIHVQGSARLRLTDGSVMRVGYAGKTGHPYTGIARLLVKRGEGTAEAFTMAGLKAWLAAHPDRRDPLFKENRSYIFFREVTETGPQDGPVGAAGLPLTAGRSLAVDSRYIPYGALVHVSAGISGFDTKTKEFSRLMVADDTGSAIKGPARGDIFTGSGNEAGALAGSIRHQAVFTLLLPKAAPAGGATD